MTSAFFGSATSASGLKCGSYLFLVPKKVVGPQLNEKRMEPYLANAGHLTSAAGSQSPYFCLPMACW
jgi:hypothetical protein